MALSLKSAQKGLLQELSKLQKREEKQKREELASLLKDKQLFEVEITRTLSATMIVFAEDRTSAEQIASDYSSDMTNDQFEDADDEYYAKGADLLHPDNVNCVPYGIEQELSCKTIHAILFEANDVPVTPNNPKQPELF